MNILVKHDINIKDIRIWPLTDQDNETCGNVHVFGERAKSLSYSLNANTQTVNSDGVTVGSYTGTPNGQGTLGLTELTPEEREMILSNKCAVMAGSGIKVVNTGKNDVAPYVRFACVSELEDGKVNLYKFLRVKFAPYEKRVDQISENGQATFSTIQIPFTFYNTCSESEGLEGKLYEAKAVDLTTEAGQAFYTAWMTIGDFVGGDALINTSYITTESGTEPVESIAEGSYKIHGDSTGGTGTVKYDYQWQVYDGGAWGSYTSAGTNTENPSSAISVEAGKTYRFKCTAHDQIGQEVSKTWRMTAASS